MLLGDFYTTKLEGTDEKQKNPLFVVSVIYDTEIQLIGMKQEKYIDFTKIEKLWYCPYPQICLSEKISMGICRQGYLENPRNWWIKLTLEFIIFNQIIDHKNINQD